MTEAVIISLEALIDKCDCGFVRCGSKVYFNVPNLVWVYEYQPHFGLVTMDKDPLCVPR